MQKDILIAQILLDDWQNKDFINSILLHFKGSSKILKLANMLIDYLNGKKDEQFIKTLNDLVSEDVIAIINHNDALSSQELNKLSSKTDNDNNVVHICQAVDNFSRLISFRIRRVIYLTNTNGLLDNN
jgi:glutamate 5-kinase